MYGVSYKRLTKARALDQVTQTLHRAWLSAALAVVVQCQITAGCFTAQSSSWTALFAGKFSQLACVCIASTCNLSPSGCSLLEHLRQSPDSTSYLERFQLLDSTAVAATSAKF